MVLQKTRSVGLDLAGRLDFRLFFLAMMQLLGEKLEAFGAAGVDVGSTPVALYAGCAQVKLELSNCIDSTVPYCIFIEPTTRYYWPTRDLRAP